MKLEEIVALSVKHNVSDLHLCNSAAPRWRRQGRLEPAPFPAPDIANLLNDWLDAAQLLHWQEHGQIDFALNLACGARLRASAFAHTRGISLVLRLLPEQCPRLDMLGAPPALSELLAEESGLLLVTGATGSGKSTTLAAMVGHLNQHLDGHILTLEDPVEFIHHSERCLIQQREVGRHCPSFAAALRVALREIGCDPARGATRQRNHSPGVNRGGDRALVMATLHTRGAAPAVERLIDVFPAEEKDQVRSQLAGSLCAVLAQKLLPARQGGRVALYELLVNTPAVANLIREGKVHQLPGVMQTGMQAGMLTFTQSFQQRVAAGAL